MNINESRVSIVIYRFMVVPRSLNFILLFQASDQLPCIIQKK